MYNRIGDLFFMVLYVGVSNELIGLLLRFAVLAKSSLYLCQYWLPVAIERPTPVSSLLHSSTIVVAGVYLAIMYNMKLLLVIAVILLSINLVGHIDVKKNIAYSTSIHLLVIVMMVGNRQHRIVVIYIILHRLIKGLIFQSSRYYIHRNGSQDMRKYSITVIIMFIVIRMILLCA